MIALKWPASDVCPTRRRSFIDALQAVLDCTPRVERGCAVWTIHDVSAYLRIQERTASHGIGMRYKVRYIDPSGDERSKVFPDRQLTAAQAFLHKIEHDKARGAFLDPAGGTMLPLLVYTREQNPIYRNSFNHHVWEPALRAAGIPDPNEPTGSTHFGTSMPRCCWTRGRASARSRSTWATATQASRCAPTRT